MLGIRLMIIGTALAVCANGQTVRQILASGYSNGFYPLTFDEDTGRQFTFTNTVEFGYPCI